MDNIEIFYFSGTGNSLHIAKELQKLIQNVKLTPIVDSLKFDTVKTNSEITGFIFPLYLTTVPKPVDAFFKKLDLSNSNYSFTVITRIGTFSTANFYIDKVLKRNGFHIDAGFLVNMANNSPAGIRPFADQKWTDKITTNKISDIEKSVREDLNFIADCVKNKKRQFCNNSKSLLSRILEPLMTSLTINNKESIPFFADKTCTKCHICENVCPTGKVKFLNDEVVWDASVQCYYCYACFNFCPTQSILIRNKYEKKLGRYHHPNIDHRQIAAQKS